MRKMLIIIKREYLVRVRSRAFLIGTIISPLFLLGLIILPSLLAIRGGSTAERRITIVDQSGDPGLFTAIKERVESRGSGPSPEAGLEGGVRQFLLSLQVLRADESPSEFIKRDYGSKGGAGSDTAYLVLVPGVLDDVEPEYHAKNLSDFAVRAFEESVSSAIAERRLMRAGFDARRIGQFLRPVDLKTFKIDASGESTEGRVRQDFMVAFTLLFFLYMSVLLYGIFVMRGVIEEKQSRIVEVVISSINPTQMMLGKVIGIGLVGLTQIGIWALSSGLLSLFGATILASRGMKLPGIPPSLLVYFIIYFLLGFFLYASLYAMVGAMVSSEEDAQHAQFPVTMLIVVPMVIFGLVMSNPSSTSSIVLSMVPFFAPTLMMLRIAIINPPLWQVLLSIGIMVVSILSLLWLAARIYRVGILMYGKRPSIAELGRWVRYS